MMLRAWILTLLPLVLRLRRASAQNNECNSPLGLENGTILDSQLTASSQYSSTYSAAAARLNGRGWGAGYGYQSEYLQVDLLIQHEVTSYTIQGTQLGWYTTSLALHYSLDGLVWTKYVTSEGDDVMGGSQNMNTPRTYQLEPSIKTRYLAFQPLTWSGRGALRLELFGCGLDQQIPTRHTLVPETIQDQQEWIPSQSPYVINSEVRMLATGSLRIQPGVMVIFNTSQSKLSVLGSLEATGLAGLPVVFTHPYPVKHYKAVESKMWNTIQTFHQSNLTLEYCVISGAKAGITGPLSSLTLRNCQIQHNDQGLELTDGDTEIRTQVIGTRITNNKRGIYGSYWGNDVEFYFGIEDSEINDNSDNGVQFDSGLSFSAKNSNFSSNGRNGLYSSYYENLLIDNCKFIHNTQDGMNLYKSGKANTTVIIRKSAFESNGHDGLSAGLSYDSTGLTMSISDCSISTNGYSGFELNSRVPNGMQLQISDSFLLNNDNGAIRISATYYSSEGNIVIKNNTFQASASRTQFLVDVYAYSLSAHASTSFINNTFLTRKAIKGSGEKFMSYEIKDNLFQGLTEDYGLYLLGGKTDVVGNRFVNCSSETVLYSKSPATNINRNVFENPVASHDVVLEAEFDDSVVINATYNYWGKDDKFYVRSRICDFYCNIKSPMAQTHPHYADSDLTLLSEQTDSELFSQMDGSIGGMLTQSISLEENLELNVDRSLYVPDGLELTITRNTTLKFPFKQGIYVKGRLTVVGDEDGPVRMRSSSSDDTDWNGVIVNGTGLTLSHAAMQDAVACLSIQTNQSGSIDVSDVAFSGCGISMLVTTWSRVEIVLRRLKVQNCPKWLELQRMSRDPTTLNVSDSLIEDKEGVKVYSWEQQETLNMYIQNTNITSSNEELFQIHMASSNFRLFASESVFTTSAYRPGIDVQTNETTLQLSGVTLKGSYVNIRSKMTSLHVVSSVFELGRSGNVFAQQGLTKPSLFENNTFIASRSSYGLYLRDSGTVIVKGNKFVNCGIMLNGKFGNFNIESNIFEDPIDAMHLFLQPTNEATFDVTKNMVNGGKILLKSLSETISVTRNTFNESLLNMDSPHVVMHENIFLNGSGYDIKFRDSGYSDTVINCTFNYWGTVSRKEIDKRLYDASDDESLPKINFIPFFAYPNMTEPQFPEDSFIADDGSIGGNVGGNVTLPVTGSPYTVTGNILIGAKEELTIEAGVTILFPKGVGVSVVGSLKVLGNETHPVKALPRVIGEKWSGIRTTGQIYRPSWDTPTIRLVNGASPREGRLEVNVNGTWGTVCSYAFGTQDAMVACYMLGYEPDRSYFYNYGTRFGEGTGPIHYTYLNCEGNEEQLSDCPNTVVTYCRHSNDVGLSCPEKVLPTQEDIGNRVELRHLVMNDTMNGLELSGNVKYLKTVESSHSDSHGITLHLRRGGVTTFEADNLRASFNAKSGLGMALDRENLQNVDPSVIISNCDLSHNSENGLFVEYFVKMNVTECQFISNKQLAIQLRSAVEFRVANSNFSGNKRGVLRMNTDSSSPKEAQISITTSNFEDHDLRQIYPKHLIELFSRYLTKSVYKFLDNYFTRNFGNVFHFGQGTNYDILIKNNTFEDSNSSLLLLDYSPPTVARYLFVDNVIANNTPLDVSQPLMKVGQLPDTNTSLFDISRNMFLRNRAEQVMLFTQTNWNGKLSIMRNTFEENIVNHTVKVDFYGYECRHNVFSNPMATAELVTPAFMRWSEVDARWNYWGSADLEYVLQRISSFDADMRRGYAHYLPFFLSQDLGDVYPESNSNFWIANNYGGTVDSVLRLTAVDSPIYIKRSIRIRDKGVLEIDGGVELKFAPFTGIYVDGVLLAGDGTDTVVMAPASNESWFGITLPYKTEGVSKTIRLVGGPSANIGRVEMFHNGTWMGACSISESKMCHDLGFSAENAEIIYNDPFGVGSGYTIYDLGCPPTASSMSECKPKFRDYGYCSRVLRCSHSVAYTGQNRGSRLNKVYIEGTYKGLTIQTPTVHLTQCHISHTVETGLDVVLKSDALDLDLGGTVVEHGSGDGIVTHSLISTRIRNGTSRHNRGHGITLKGHMYDVRVEDMVFQNNSKKGINNALEIYNPSTKYLRINRNQFKDHVSEKAIDFQMYMRPTTFVYIEDNQFINNSAGTCKVYLTSNNYDRASTLFFTGNKIDSSGDVFIHSPNYISVVVSDNTVVNSTGNGGCFLTFDVYNHGDQQARNISLLTNTFEEMHGPCVVRLQSTFDQYPFNGDVKYNQIYNSDVRDGAVLVDSPHFTFFQNLFDNPKAAYELKVVRLGDLNIQAENNWWGTADSVVAGKRILHKVQDQRLLQVDYLPTLSNQNFDCSAVNNCSGQGECVRPNGCRCDSGWAGADCTDYDCAGVGNCNGNGVCLGPNQCQCSEGWEGSSCVLATCHGVNDCGGNERGYCVLPDRCTCFPQFSGPDCSQCAQRRWGKSCLPCPKCEHGTCNITNGLCECESINWSGELCDLCSETYYGPDCLPFINVLNVIPSTGPDRGGTRVHVWGHNFPETQGDTFYCQFDGNKVVNGTRLSKEHVVCTTPQHPSGDVHVEISPEGQKFTTNKTVFTFFAVCPPGACGKTETPPHGQCLYGGCVCNLPWTGEDCSIELKAPVFSPVNDQEFSEGREYTFTPSLAQGSQPISWSIRGSPRGMTIDQRSGQIYWERAVASLEPYTIIVRAANVIGRSESTWILTVSLSYNLTIDEISPTGILPRPKSIQIKGHVSFFVPSTTSLVAFGDISVRNKGRTSKMPVITSQAEGYLFETVYFPKADDSGLFQVDGHHPSDTSFTAQKSWRVLGMKCSPGYLSRQAYLDTSTVEMRDVAVLENVGVDTIYNITAQVEGIGGPLSSAIVRVGNVPSSDDSRPMIDSLKAETQVSFDLILTASRPLSGTIAVVFSTAEGTQARTRVYIQLKVRRPVLITTPTSLTDSIPRGVQKSFQINVTNEGDVPATSLRVTLPTEPRLSLTAFSTERAQASEDGLTLEPGETAVLVLTVTVGADDALGEFRGSVALNSDLSSAVISYRFYVTSLDKLNVTVRVEDEYTYFASDKPLVSGAVVTLRNPRRGFREVRTTTNETEHVIFEDVHEDRYTLTATAPGHGSYSAVIIAKPSEKSFSVFLQRVAVKYTWTVTPTTFQDKYIITLDSTFETRVPMPVVTIDPANVNTIPYEEGRKNVINFNITNHGLIRADNVRLVLPENHPILNFTQTIDPIGNLDASTSLIVPVLVNPKPRVRRNIAAAAACGMKMLYDYVCGGPKTGGQGVTLSRQYPGRPPLPCSFGGGGGGGGGGSGQGGGGGYVGVSGTTGESSSSTSNVQVEYNAVTPLTCDCAETLIQKCALEFVPILGCGMATAGLGNAKGMGGAAKAAIDFGFACLSDPLTSTVYTAVNCIYVMESECDASSRNSGSNLRMRRDASSEIVEGVMQTNVALQNYMTILQELFGGEEVFELTDKTWLTSFNLALADDSVAGSALSQSEITSITATLNDTQKDIVEKFLLRWNRTMTAWDNGTLTSLGPEDGVMSYNVIMTRFEQFKTDTENSKQRGFTSVFDDFGNSVNAYNENKKKKDGKKDDGVCAKVRVRIIQELVLTRDAFNAKLELENGEQSALENINVTVVIRATYGDATLTNNLFSIGSPKLVGITGVDGTGRLERDVSGTAEWLIIPYSAAAVKEDTLYDVGGTLSYTVDGSDFSIPLLPDTITVKPNPSLIVNYFHEKYVQGDDPMTKDKVEPVVPFTLAVMVSNGAYGVARQLKITSGQPEIIENEKGLLVSFKIIGAQLGKNPVTPSLAINFGDIESFETKTARWLLTSSLKGKFYNFTATFENINPLGDPQLSVMEQLGYHELVHLVRLESSEDQFDDFLVNDILDEDEMPDVVYDSSNGFYSSPVMVTDIESFTLDDSVQSTRYRYVTLTVKLVSELPVFGYTRVVNNLTNNFANESLLRVIRDNGQNILIGKNSWLTSHYHDSFYFHLFDRYSPSDSNRTTYSLLFGPKNVHPPSFSQSSFEVLIGVRFQPSIIFKLSASDNDTGSRLTYTMSPSTLFEIEQSTGIIKNILPVAVGVYEIFVTVTDDGVPALSSNVSVVITVRDDIAPTSSSEQFTSSSSQSSSVTPTITSTTIVLTTSITPSSSQSSLGSVTATITSTTVPRTSSSSVTQTLTPTVVVPTITSLSQSSTSSQTLSSSSSAVSPTPVSNTLTSTPSLDNTVVQTETASSTSSFSSVERTTTSTKSSSTSTTVETSVATENMTPASPSTAVVTRTIDHMTSATSSSASMRTIDHTTTAADTKSSASNIISKSSTTKSVSIEPTSVVTQSPTTASSAVPPTPTKPPDVTSAPKSTTTDGTSRSSKTIPVSVLVLITVIIVML